MTPKQLKQAAAVMLAAAEGKPIECRRNGNKWHLHGHPFEFNWASSEYRVAVTKPSINWDHVHPDYKWMATDQNGKVFLHTTKPHIDGDSWTGNLYAYTCSYASFVPGTCDWKDSLVVRPGVE